MTISKSSYLPLSLLVSIAAFGCDADPGSPDDAALEAELDDVDATPSAAPLASNELAAPQTGAQTTVSLDGLAAGDIVRLTHEQAGAFIHDDGDGSVSASTTTDDPANYWELVDSVYGTQFKNVATGQYLKTSTTECKTGSITGPGDGASWSEILVNGGVALKNYKRGTCCEVDSASDTVISHGDCQNPDSLVRIEALPREFFLVDIDLTAHQAQDYCASLGTNLATISNENTNDLVAELCEQSGDVLCYTGLNDEASEGVNAWVDGSPMIYENWDATPQGGNNIDCGTIGAVQRSWIDYGAWEYGYCDAVPRPFICNGPQMVREYVLVDIDMTATDAQAHCQSLGEDYNLATITSPEENAIVAALCEQSSDVLCYIGLNDKANEGVNQWTDGAPMVFENWDATPQGGNGIDCGTIGGVQRSWIDYGAWEYGYCDAVPRPFICSHPVPA